MTDTNSSRSKSTVDFPEAQDGQNQASDLLPVINASDIVSEFVPLESSARPALRASINLTGNNGNNTLRGTNQRDTLRGLGGNDRLIGRNRGDQLFGDSGNDQLFGNNGNDTLNGGSDRDRLEGESGNDILIGGSGQDTLIGSSGEDSLQGDSGNDQMNGGSSKDTLVGGSGDDRLIGGSDRDIINGGLGQDTLSGGAGSDRFVYNSFDDRGDVNEDNLFDERGDEIADFNTDIDVMDLRNLFTGSNYSDPDPFKEYVLVVNDDDDNTFIRVDIDGDSGDAPFRTLATLTDVDFDDVGRGNFIV